MASRRWLDLSRSNASFTPIMAGKEGNKKQIVACIGDISKTAAQALSKDFGFRRLDGVSDIDVYVSMRYTKKETGKLSSKSIPFDEIAALFDGSEIKEMESKDIMSLWNGLTHRSTGQIAAHITTNRAIRALDNYEDIGLNEDGNVVYMTPSNERFIFPDQINDPEFILFEKDPSRTFLNYKFDFYTDIDFNSAALSLLREIESGRLVDQDRLDMLIETSALQSRLTSKTAAQVQSKIVTKMQSMVLADYYNQFDKSTIDEAKLTELNNIYTTLVEPNRIKKFTNQAQSKLLSPAYGILNRSILEAVDDVVSLTLVNSESLGGLSFVPKEIPVSLVGNRIDSAPINAFEELNGHIQTTELNINNPQRIRGKSILATCEYGLLDSPVVIDDLTVNRKDHLQALNICRGIDDDAVAMLVINGDEIENIGRVSFESNAFHQAIFRNYNVVDMLDVAPNLLGESNQEHYKRVYILNGKRLVESQSLAPSELKTAYGPNDIIQFSKSIASNFNKTGTLKNVDVSELVNSNSVSDLLQNYIHTQKEAARFELNFAQAQYTPLTNLVAPKSSAQPVNFVSAAREASIKLVRDVGNPDQFLLSELKLPKEHITEVWDAEQIDAITLGIWRLRNNRPYLEGDATGKGKGRVLSALMYWSIINEKKPVFMTSSADLLSDIWRDIKDCQLDEYIHPFFIAGDAIIDKSDGSVILSADTVKGQRDAYINSKSTNIAENAVFTTYSQINHLKQTAGRSKSFSIEKRLNDRATWLHEYMKNNETMLVVDESHNVSTGTSNQGKLFELLSKANGSLLVRSSATWAKDASNVAQCSDMFPEEYTPEVLRKMVATGGTGSQELLSSTLIAEGAMVRREHDYGKRQVEVYESQDYQRNRDATDTLAEIMSLTRRYASRQFDILRSRTYDNTKHQNIDEYSFASSFGLLSDAFTNALRADEVFRQCVNMINSKEKPIIGVDKTAETTVKYLFDSLQEDDANKHSIILDEFPSFETMLHRWVENEGSRRLRVTLVPTAAEIALAAKENRLPKPERETIRLHWKDELDANSAEYIELLELENEIKSLIPNMPFLPLSPIDYVKCQLEAEGITITEVSGRSLEIVHDNGKFIIKPRTAITKAQAQFDFNSNNVDGIIVTRAGTEGISLHAQDSFLKYSPDAANRRNIVLMGTFLYIVDEEQFFGRGERKGQSIPSRSSKITTGMPIEARLLALSERNRLKLSASTTGNARSLKATNSVPNFLNSFGDEVTAEYLYDNQHVMDLLGFEDKRKRNIVEYGDSKEKSNQIRSLTGSVLGRMMLLKYDQQQALLDDLTMYFNTKLDVLQAKGVDPINTRVIRGQVNVKHEEVMFGKVSNHYTSEFDKPVIGQSLEITAPPIEINPKVIENEIFLTKKTLGNIIGSADGSTDDFAIQIITEKDNLLKITLDRYNNRSVLLGNYRKVNTFASIQEAIASKKINDIQKVNTLLDNVANLYKYVKTGDILELPNTQAKWVLTGIKLPKTQSEMTLSYCYAFTFASTDGEISKHVPMDTLMYHLSGDASNYKQYKIGEFSIDHPIVDEFNAISIDGITSYFQILTGNMLEASRLNAERNLGQQITIKDSNGLAFNAIKLKPDLRLSSIKNMNFTASSKINDLFIDYVKKGISGNETYILCHQKDKNQETEMYIYLSRQNTFNVTLPKTIAGRKGLDRDNPFNGIEVSKKGHDSRSDTYKSYIFNLNQIDEVLSILNEQGFNLTLNSERCERINQQLHDSTSTMSPTQKIEEQLDIEEMLKTTPSERTESLSFNEQTDQVLDDELSNIFSAAERTKENLSALEETNSIQGTEMNSDVKYSNENEEIDSELDEIFNMRL